MGPPQPLLLAQSQASSQLLTSSQELLQPGGAWSTAGTARQAGEGGSNVQLGSAGGSVTLPGGEGEGCSVMMGSGSSEGDGAKVVPQAPAKDSPAPAPAVTVQPSQSPPRDTLGPAPAAVAQPSAAQQAAEAASIAATRAGNGLLGQMEQFGHVHAAALGPTPLPVALADKYGDDADWAEPGQCANSHLGCMLFSLCWGATPFTI